MEFLGKHIPTPPAECPNRDKCIDNVQLAGTQAETASKIISDLMPSSPCPNPNNPLDELITFVAEASNNTLKYLQNTVRPADRCAACVISCAVDIRRNDGTV